VQLRKDVQDAILRKIQQSESNFDRASLEAIYGKEVIQRHLVDLIEVHLINGRVMHGISPTAHGNYGVGVDGCWTSIPRYRSIGRRCGLRLTSEILWRDKDNHRETFPNCGS
jgi:hypothetical protein